MASNHGFVDGNKRTTLLLLHDLISNSGYQLKALDNEDLNQAVENIILAAASSTITIQQLMDWFQPRIERV
jgi:prophage maintenance system killer protein